MLHPTSRLTATCLAWLALALAPVAFPAWSAAWLALGGCALAVFLVDAVLVKLQPRVEIERRLPGRFALGEPCEVVLKIRNPHLQPLRVVLFDGIPADALAPTMPWRGMVPAKREIRVGHPVTLRTRGEAVFSPARLRHRSPLGLWDVQTTACAPQRVKVYPNFEPVVRYALLAMQHRESPMGIQSRPRTGSSREFHQLRDYREGDPPAQIDWKASSRRQQLISRDFREQRDQSIIFMLDTGRRMRAIDGDLPQFDHVLNAVLLVAHIALRQGDQVAVKSFGGSDRWLPPLKGAHAMPTLLNHLYDFQTTAAPSDFAAAAESLMTRQKRRALIVLLTNLRGEDGKELVPAIQLLNTRHLVLLASLREHVIDAATHTPVDGFPAALRFLAADRYFEERREILASMNAAGVITRDCTARELAITLANSYFDIKSAGRL
jgi:uncharacterized protein (DUF58 family)